MEQGQQIGDWRCINILGKGSFGIVGLWKNSKTAQLNAVKKFEVRLSNQEGGDNDKTLLVMQQRWKKEVELMYSVISSPYVVSAAPVPPELAASIPVGNGNLPLLCMEYCSGGDLRQVLKRPENICGLREKNVLTLLDHISKGIIHLHEKNIIHRDLKPENILVHIDSANNVTYKLSDLGLAKDLSNSQSFCSTLVGTPQYLAPEIYREKKYDKTVDYWSFGLIAYEVMCGHRAFLHAESPATWLPLVETKPKDVITIYRDDEGKIQFSEDIHYCSHLSERVKNCLVTWLRTMLQLDPSRRGKKLSDISDSSLIPFEPKNTDPNAAPPSPSPNFGLKMLSKTLNARFLQIHTLTKVVEVSVGTRTKIAEVQEWISQEISLPIDNQLIFTIDGKEVQKMDLAAKFIDHADLYLIPRNAESIKLKLKMPKILNNFLTQWESMRDPLKLDLVWSCAIFFIQVELEKIETVKKACEALKAWLTLNYTNTIKTLKQEIEKSASGLGKLLKLEKDLEEIDSEFMKQIKSQNEKEEENQGVNFWSQEMSTLQNVYLSSLANWEENIVLKPVRISELEEIYHKLLESCSGMKSVPSINSTSLYNEVLVRTVCQFVVERDQISESYLQNLKIQLNKVQLDTKFINEMKSIGGKLEEISGSINKSRCAKHSALMKKVYGDPVILNGTINASNKENSSPTYATVKKNMSQSAIVVSPTNATGASGSPSKSPALMVASLNSPLSRPPSSMFMSQLKEESEMWSSKMEASIQSLRDSMEEIKEIGKIKEELSWDFLD